MIAAVTIVVLAIVIALAIALVVNHTAKTIGKTGIVGGLPPAAKYTVGDTARSGSFAFTVLGVQDPFVYPDQNVAPRQGGRFVAVNVQVANLNRSAHESFSAQDGFHLLDSGNEQFDETTLAGLKPGAPEGAFAGGQARRGFIVFDIPRGANGLTLRCQGSITAPGAVFRVP